jgi:hypothetical protein
VLLTKLWERRYEVAMMTSMQDGDDDLIYLASSSTHLTSTTFFFKLLPSETRLGIRGTHLKSSIQDIVDEVAPIKKALLWG